MAFSESGNVVPTGVTDPGLISQAKADAYNDAVANVLAQTYTYDPGAQEYFDTQAQQAMDQVSQAVDAYVASAQVLIEVATINEMSQQAAAADDERLAIELQDYMAANDVTLEEPEIDQYNESLQEVERAAQVAGAYMSIAANPEMVEQANTQANNYLATFDESTGVFFDAADGKVTVNFDTYNMAVQLDVLAFYVTDVQVIDQGAQTTFFTSSPESGCWFIQDQVEREACMYGG